MSFRSALTFRVASATGLFAVALVIGGYLARPLRTASIGFDSQVAVVDFARLLAGRHVEEFLSTTPKPLLTLIFGPLELLSHDWRPLVWATLIAFGLAVVFGAELARRIGGTPAWAFVGIGLAGSGALLFDVGYALAMPWALLGWVVAGLAISRPSPRYGLAGLALLVATLARLETLLIVGMAALVLLALQIGPVTRAAEAHGIKRPPRRAWLILIAFGALPIMGIHDLLIYADPLFWSTVPARYSALTTRKILRAPALIGWLVGRYIGLWPLAVLGVVGAIRLIRIRSWGVLVGLAALGPGMAAFLVFLALRHIWIPDRYAAPIDLALIMAGGIAAAWLLDLGLARLRSRPDGHSATSPRRVEVLAATAAAGLAIIAIWPSGFFDAGLARSVHTSLALAADVDQMAPILRGIIDRSPSTRTWPAEGSTSGMPLLLVPQPYRPRLSIDLDVPLTSLGNVTIGAGPTGRPLVGQFVAYDRHAEASTLARKPYQTTTTVVLDGVRIVPVGSDPARGWWITEILPAL